MKKFNKFANILSSTISLSREEWLKLRKNGLGGSDIGAILKLNKYKSPLKIFIEKTSDEIEEINSESAYWGTVLEDIVFQEFKKRNENLVVQRKNAVLQHPEYNWALANIDGLVKDEAGEYGILEIKTASEYMKKEWQEDKIPDTYYLQIQHYMWVTNINFAYLAVLIGGNKYFQYEKIERNEEVIEIIKENGTKFWNEHILKNNPPEFDGSESSEKIINSMYPNAEKGKQIELLAEEKIEEINKLKEQEKEIEAKRKKLEEEIKAEMQDAEIAICNNYKISWKNQIRNSFDSKALKSEEPELYEKYTKSSELRVFKITS